MSKKGGSVEKRGKLPRKMGFLQKITENANFDKLFADLINLSPNSYRKRTE